MIYKYYTYLTNYGLAKWKLVPKGDIENLAKGKQDFFESIENYDENGNKISCPVYLDFDGASAQDDALEVAAYFMEHYDSQPKIWLSSSYRLSG
jgi:hypothetical protein